MEILDVLEGWTIEWSGTRTSGKLVRLHNPVTGQLAVGHDWSDWDRALNRAIANVELSGSLMAEVEEYLRSR